MKYEIKPNNHISLVHKLYFFPLLFLACGKKFPVQSFNAFQNPLSVKVGGRERAALLLFVGGYLDEGHARSWKNDPTSKSKLNQRGIANTTHSKAIKNGQGGVFVCEHVYRYVCLTRSERKGVGNTLTINRIKLNCLVFPLV